MIRGRGRPWLLVPLALLASAATALGQGAPQQRVAAFAWDEKQVLRLSIGFRDIVDPATSKNLAGGLPTTIVMQAFAFRESGGEPLAVAFKSCRVTFDLWDEIYRIELSQSGYVDAVAASPTLEGVLRRCAEVDRLPVAHRSTLQGKGRIYVAILVEVNPVSAEMLDRIRRWVNRPATASGTAPGDAIFGSFVGLFVTRIGAADREIRIRTQSIVP